MCLSKEILLRDAKLEDKTLNEKEDEAKTNPFELLMRYFVAQDRCLNKCIPKECENGESVKGIYEKLGWKDVIEGRFDVINSFWQTFTWAMHDSFPSIYCEADKGNIKIYKYCYNGYQSFPQKYIESEERSQIRQQVEELLRENPKIREFAAICHCVANFMPCPDGDFNVAKGSSRAKDYLPLMIDLIQECIEKNEPLQYSFRNKEKIIEVERLKEWRKWFVNNREGYCLSGYYEVVNNDSEHEIIKGKMLFEGQKLGNPFPKSKEELTNCIEAIWSRIDERANMLLACKLSEK
ncbi:MAG: hypothetical protein J5649_00310 [Lachnospiraceae bacterium]|nr:hypothetical protein [Lachnospiraceae bacterium]